MSDEMGWVLTITLWCGLPIVIAFVLVSLVTSVQEAAETAGFGCFSLLGLVCFVGIIVLACLALTGNLALIGLE